MTQFDKYDLYQAWAPVGAPWSPWAKPVLFATFALESTITPPPSAAIDVAWAPAARREAREGDRAASYRDQSEPAPTAPGDTAIVLELPGTVALETALALAAIGYRPVPVLSATPSPYTSLGLVDVRPLQAVLGTGAQVLRSLPLPLDAPPAFVLDARRMPETRAIPGQYDNRSLLFPQDFPSASHLRDAGIARVLLVTHAAAVQRDLAHVLVRYRDAGLVVEVQAPDAAVPRRPLTEDAPSEFRSMMYRALALFGLKRNAAGGFGALIPVPSEGGGG